VTGNRLFDVDCKFNVDIVLYCCVVFLCTFPRQFYFYTKRTMPKFIVRTGIAM
jgi:hypothetical protein